ncbi:MAG: anaerobic ribonucleoside-triphosphate reductase [Clostridia bacterium]|jgi:anaerobic ribonucleoside-triphosphate reductase|nr:anaerobic ribonucleoside-triphosphate reductase [Clostridia bacterium]MEE0791250.1 anaerobic ribonucleoside-triphosphate reductase [Clostridia bacterium]HCF64773.1 anaerobic ribonucleoside-triphosphate reductase [Clostridiales bacterium]
MQVIKRDGKIVDFDRSKIRTAIEKANKEVKPKERASKEEINEIINYIEELDKKRILVEDIQDIIEEQLMSFGKYALSKKYITYRYTRALVRKSNTTDQSIKELIEGENEYWNNENSNKNAQVVTTQRDYLAGITSTDITRRFLLPEDVVKAHDEGIIHFHDADYFAQNALTNCELINLEDMLQNGTIMNGVMIEKPHRFLTAMTIATQIILGVTSSTYGGATVSLTHLAPFVRSSYDRYYKKYKQRGLSEKQCEEYAKQDIKKEIEDGVQTFNYQVNSMTNTNGQAPFLSVCMYLGETDEYKKELAMIIEEFLKQRIEGFKNEKGVYITPAFPKLLYILEEDNIRKGSKYWYLTELAAKCTAKRLVPDYISEKKMKEYKIDKNGNGNCYPCMGCRSFLTPYVDPETNKPKYYGRFNQGVVTINLVDVALSSNQDEDKFWKIYEERLELCHKALRIRHERLSKVTSDVAPILWQHGALARLKKGESIDKLLHNGYSTISLGYAGLYECVKYMTGNSHTDGGVGEAFALKVMQKLNDKCKQWKEAEQIDYSVYGTPIESTTYKFAKCLKKRFGVVEGITDRNYITNSYHVPVFEDIDAFSKLKLESKFQKLSPGGAISYIETPNLQNNLEVVLQVIQFIYDNIMYAELNTKSDYCQKCGFDGEILINDNLEWYCPNCGNKDHNTLNVARRTCGYIGSQFWNKGRTQEIKERVLHIDNKDDE